jgi:RNA polymerase sigma-70 factor (ECF subfamily)
MDEDVRRAQAGDRFAVERLLAGIAPAVYRFGRRMCGNEHDAEDVVQDTLLNVALHLDTFEGRASFSSWVFALARSACARQRRGLKNRPPMADSSAVEQDDRAPSPEALAAEREVLGDVRDALDRLTPEAREVILLRDVEGLPALEAAAALEISVDALKSRLHRARAALRRELEPKGGIPAAPAEPGCPDVLALWSRKLDGELRPVDCAQMEAHVAVCRSCRVACDGLKQALLACRAVSTAVVPARVREQVKAATLKWAEAR